MAKQTQEKEIRFNRADSFGDRYRSVRKQVGKEKTRAEIRQAIRAARRKGSISRAKSK